jgi:hypothetical protein
VEKRHLLDSSFWSTKPDTRSVLKRRWGAIPPARCARPMAVSKVQGKCFSTSIDDGQANTMHAFARRSICTFIDCLTCPQKLNTFPTTTLCRYTSPWANQNARSVIVIPACTFVACGTRPASKICVASTWDSTHTMPIVG